MLSPLLPPSDLQAGIYKKWLFSNHILSSRSTAEARAGTDSLPVTVKKHHSANAVMVAQWGLHFTYFMSGGGRERKREKELRAALCASGWHVFVRLCVFVRVGGIWLVKMWGLIVSRSRYQYQKHRVTPLVFYLRLICDFIRLAGPSGRRGYNVLPMLGRFISKLSSHPVKIKNISHSPV